MDDWVLYVLLIVVMLLFFVVIIRAIIVSQKNAKPLPEKQEGTFFYENTKVIKKGIRSRSEGLKISRCIVEFGVLFQTATGEEKFFLVTEETFEKIQEEQIGTLVVVNGEFFDFGDGEEIQEANKISQ